MWEGDTDPLDAGNWPLLAPSPLPYRPDSQVPREMSREDIDSVVAQHVSATERAMRAGFDLLELHFAHGYLVSSFLSPLSNRRTDEYGGDLAGRATLALEIFDAVRAAWPADRPMSVRISATDWAPGGFTGTTRSRSPRCSRNMGATSSTYRPDRPRWRPGRRTAGSTRHRSPTGSARRSGIPTMTVGAVASVDDANTIVMSGRADLVVIARPHLVDPYWTLNAALDQGYDGHEWPNQYLSGRSARRREQHA